MQVFDRAGQLISEGDKVAWASKHAANAILKIGVVEKIEFEVKPAQSWGGKDHEIVTLRLRVRITKYGWGAAKGTTYLARAENTAWREKGAATSADDLKFYNLEKV